MFADELEKLEQLKARGTLTPEQFEEAKNRLLSGSAPASDGVFGIGEGTWCMLMHLAQLLGYAAPVLGWVCPIVMWAVSKDRSVMADRHGRVILNWILSSLIYFIVGGLLSFLLIGIPLLIALVVVSVIFVIIGAIRANDGILWPYPLSIRFFHLA
jgi:uncharacterized Tic20 family protein